MDFMTMMLLQLWNWCIIIIPLPPLISILGHPSASLLRALLPPVSPPVDPLLQLALPLVMPVAARML